jgi:hypothetical protein
MPGWVKVAIATGAGFVLLLAGCAVVLVAIGSSGQTPRGGSPATEQTAADQGEPHMTVELKGDAIPVELSVTTCAKTFSKTVTPPYEERVPYCDDEYETVFANALTSEAGRVDLLLKDDAGKILRQTVIQSDRYGKFGSVSWQPAR